MRDLSPDEVPEDVRHYFEEVRGASVVTHPA